MDLSSTVCHQVLQAAIVKKGIRNFSQNFGGKGDPAVFTITSLTSFTPGSGHELIGRPPMCPRVGGNTHSAHGCVTHPINNQAQRCLISVITGNWYFQVDKPLHCLIELYIHDIL